MRPTWWALLLLWACETPVANDNDAPEEMLDGSTDCDDGIACTRDGRGPGGCSHDRSNAACAFGEICRATIGCVASPPCSSDVDCSDDDACTADRCDASSATCTRTWLDQDGDGVPPEICGGGDCDDADPDRTAGLDELCNGIDDDCDGDVDEDFDLTTRFDCGGCGVMCALQQNCVAGSCSVCGIVGSECCDVFDPPCFGTCAPSGLCVEACGEAGQPCCPFDPPCATDLLCGRGVCAPRSACGDTTCDLVAGGCPAGQTCRHDGSGYRCESAALDLPVTCGRDEDCPEAFRCDGARCMPICCEAPAGLADGCPAHTTCRSGPPAGPTGACVAPCDPVANTGCAAAETCRPIGAGASCGPTRSPGARGDRCVFPGDCSAGFVCLLDMVGGSTASCQQVCRIGDLGCPAGEACERIDGSRTFGLYGVCR